jgi:hypothetical protein
MLDNAMLKDVAPRKMVTPAVAPRVLVACSLGRAAAADAPPLTDAEGFVDTGDMVELQTSGPNLECSGG